MTAGNTYDTYFKITTLGPSWSVFYLYLNGTNASNEIEASMDGASCVYVLAQMWVCNYDQPAAGTYYTAMHLKLNERLDPDGDYSYGLDCIAQEETKQTPSSPTRRSSYGFTGGGSFPPRNLSSQKQPVVPPLPSVVPLIPPSEPTPIKPTPVKPASTWPVMNITPKITAEWPELTQLISKILELPPLVIPEEASHFPIESLIGFVLFIIGAGAFIIYKIQ